MGKSGGPILQSQQPCPVSSTAEHRFALLAQWKSIGLVIRGRGFDSYVRLVNKCAWCGDSTAAVYCSHRCQQAKQADDRVKIWLETGVGVYHTSKTHWMRTYVLEDQGGVCSICGCKQVWNGRELVFILDHISGDATDNSRPNLRMICPNCDSQLDTYKGRNRGNGRRPKR